MKLDTVHQYFLLILTDINSNYIINNTHINNNYNHLAELSWGLNLKI